MRSEISLLQIEANNDKDALRDLLGEKISDIEKKVSDEAAVFKEMLDKESEERHLESEHLKQVKSDEAENLKHDLDNKTSSIQNDLHNVKDDLKSTKDEGMEELKN